MKNKKNILSICAALFFVGHSYTTNDNLAALYKKIFQNTTYYTHKQKVAFIDQALKNTNLSQSDRNTLNDLKMIINIFIKPHRKITANSVLYRTPKETIMHWAAKLDQANLMEILLQNGARIDSRNQWEKTPLHYAAEWNSPHTTKLLLSKGANIYARDQYQKTPIDYAQEHKNNAVLTVFSEYRLSKTQKMKLFAEKLVQK